MKDFFSGFVAIIGRSNVGKSTLMNKLIGEKVAIISDKPQTTRNRIQCVLHKADYQIIFVDTPGIHRPKNKLGEYMVNSAQRGLTEMDAILFVVDAASGIGSGDKRIAEMLKDINIPTVLAVNKIDKANKEIMKSALAEFTKIMSFNSIVEISALENINLDKLEQALVGLLPKGPKYYPDDMITDQPERVIIAEIIREKTLQLLQEEVPHGIGVMVESIDERADKNIVNIRASILCEKSSHKGIVIGKGGKMLKEIGTKSRIDIERLLNSKVFLDLFVKVKTDWRNNPSTMKTLGYDLREV